jgi:hypothetical protein
MASRFVGIEIRLLPNPLAALLDNRPASHDTTADGWPRRR